MPGLGIVRRAVSGAAFVALAAFPLAATAQEVNLYTTRETGLIQPLLDAFTKSTGIKVNTIFIKDGLIERVKAEGPNSPADVLMTVDFGGLIDAVDQGVTQPVRSEALASAIPANLRDPNGHWYALSLRARLVYVSKDRVPLTAITYEELADPKWKGKLCIRSGQHPYNTALIAAYIARYGEANAEAWLRGVKANLARKATGGDREVARDILGGICDIGVGNSYYVGLMRSGKGGPDQLKWGAAINPSAADLQGRRHAREHFRRRDRQARAEQGQRAEAARIPRLQRRAGALCAAELRVSGQERRGGGADHRKPRPAQARFARSCRHRQKSQTGEHPGRQGRLRSVAPCAPASTRA